MQLNLFLVPVVVVLLIRGCSSRQDPTARNIEKNAPEPHIVEAKKNTLNPRAQSLFQRLPVQ